MITNFNISQFIEALRIRENKKLKELVLESEGSARDIYFIVKGGLKPRKKRIIEYLTILDFNVDENLKVYSNHLSTEQKYICDWLIYYLDSGNIEYSTLNIKKLENIKSFSGGLNKQFLLNAKIRLEILKGNNDVRKLVENAMVISYTNFNFDNFDSKLLLFEEVELMLSLALAYKNKGESNLCYYILHTIVIGLEKLPLDDQVKKKQYIRALLYLISYLIEDNKIREADIYCDDALNFSKNICKGYKILEIAHLKSICEFKLGNIDISKELLVQVFWGYFLYKKKDKLKSILNEYRENFSEELDTYDLEIENIEEFIFKPLSRADVKSFKHIGQLIGNIRYSKNITQSQIAYGIIDRSSYVEFENKGTKEISIYQEKAILQRLGLNPKYYSYLFLNNEEFEDFKIYKEIFRYIFINDTEKVKNLINKIKEKKYFKKYVGRQFILFAESFLYREKNGYNKEYLELLREALKISIKNFDENKIAEYLISYIEIILISAVAKYFYYKGNHLRSYKIYNSILINIEKNYTDESEKLRIYSLISFNCATTAIEIGKYQETIALSKKGLDANIATEQFSGITRLATTMGEALYLKKDKKKSMHYLISAYFISKLMGLDSDAKIIKDYLDNVLIITWG